jgi:phosphoribosylglycinamide formyltransferase-1
LTVRIGALASGAGTILDALVAGGLPVALVVVDRACGAEKVSERAGLPVFRVERRDFGPGFDRDGYTDEVVEALARGGVDVVVMAGFGTVLGASLQARWSGRVLNTHPALLPAFKGWHAVEAALAAGVKVTGCTVHVVTLEVDDGPILAQEAVPVLEDDTVDSLHERIKAVERRLYPATVREFVAGLERTGDRAASAAGIDGRAGDAGTGDGGGLG